MTNSDFIKMEARLIELFRSCDSQEVIKLINLRVFQKLRTYAERKNYDITFEELIRVAVLEIHDDLELQ